MIDVQKIAHKFWHMFGQWSYYHNWDNAQIYYSKAFFHTLLWLWLPFPIPKQLRMLSVIVD